MFLESVLITCLAWNVYFEARGEPTEGQYAVAEVTLKRADISGRNVCEEVFLDRQFSWNNGGSVSPVVRNKRAWQEASEIATTIMETPTNHSFGATHYHGDYIKKPKWAYKLCETVHIGRHIFYRPCEH